MSVLAGSDGPLLFGIGVTCACFHAPGTCRVVDDDDDDDVKTDVSHAPKIAPEHVNADPVDSGGSGWLHRRQDQTQFADIDWLWLEDAGRHP